MNVLHLLCNGLYVNKNSSRFRDQIEFEWWCDWERHHGHYETPIHPDELIASGLLDRVAKALQCQLIRYQEILTLRLNFLAKLPRFPNKLHRSLRQYSAVLPACSPAVVASTTIGANKIFTPWNVWSTFQICCHRTLFDPSKCSSSV